MNVMGEASQPIGASNSSDQLNRLRMERDHALEDAAKWRRRYDVEAQQRRAEAEVADKTIRELRAEISQLCQIGPVVRPKTSLRENGVDGEAGRLKIALAELQQEHNQLANALAQEQQQHNKTRESLITALGEVMQRGK
jgi:chromosome segregation ATPase